MIVVNRNKASANNTSIEVEDAELARRMEQEMQDSESTPSRSSPTGSTSRASPQTQNMRSSRGDGASLVVGHEI